MSEQVCAVCGQGGYWVGYAPEHGEDRCLNHLNGYMYGDERSPSRIGELPIMTVMSEEAPIRPEK